MRWISAASMVIGALAGPVGGAATDADLIEAGALAPADLIKYWQCPVPLKPGEKITSLHLEDETVYAITDHGAIYVIDADVGLVRWSAVVAEPPFQLFPPTHPVTEGGKPTTEVYVTSPTRLCVFHRFTGRLLSDQKLPFTASGPAVSDGRSVYLGSVNARYCSLKPVSDAVTLLEPTQKGVKRYAVVILPDGKRLGGEAPTLAKAREWQESMVARLGGLQSERKTAIMRWMIDTEGTVVARPAVVVTRTLPDNRVVYIGYVPSDGGKLFAVNLESKTKVWEASAAGAVLTTPLVGKGMVCFAGMDRSVYGVDRLQGVRQWQCYLPVPLRRTGVLTDKVLYQPGDPSGVYAIDPVTGKLLWSCERASEYVAEQDGSVYLFDPAKAIVQLEATTGREIRVMPCPDATLSVANTRDTTLYFAEPLGRLMCVRPKGVPYLRRSKFDAALAGAFEPKGATTQQASTRRATATGPEAAGPDDPLRSRSAIPPAVNSSVGGGGE